ncbi:DUF3244 domain-containing protein [Parabacteroides sp. AM08-6]|uniref:DUF3244 domain-containing protein n=1 Tax=Parabacteroides sp. AM08-6 TaxID=2292053 RepID=UPI000F002BBD|nr:DUF3244 domain-containing protein [Parabacteroides sp. AM08-6]RHJ75365.1 DUF3244 domain-containing protein [Parabacteroides sp. AM08-6]
MQLKNLVRILSVILCFTLLLNPITLLAEDDGNTVSTVKKKDIPLDGEWLEGKRSVIADCPITVVLGATNLFIQTTSFRSDIVVRIMDGSTVVKEEIIKAPMCFLSIPLDGWETGKEYHLELTNQWGDCLLGDFSLD